MLCLATPVFLIVEKNNNNNKKKEENGMIKIDGKSKIIKIYSLHRLGAVSLAVVVILGGSIYSGQASAKPKVKITKSVDAPKNSTQEASKNKSDSESPSYWPSNKAKSAESNNNSANSSNNGRNNLVSNIKPNFSSQGTTTANSNSNANVMGAVGAGAAGVTSGAVSAKNDPCARIIQAKNQTCSGQECDSKQKMLDVSYQMCSANEEDIVKTRRPGSLEERQFKTSTGFAYAFKNVEINLTNPGTNYNKMSAEYIGLKNQYQPIKRKNNEYLGQGKFMDRSTYQNLIEQEKKIEEGITKLDLILASNSDYDRFKASYKKFVPDILLDKPEYDKKYRNKTFTKIECEFLNLTFRVDVINELQKKYNYECAA